MHQASNSRPPRWWVFSSWLEEGTGDVLGGDALQPCRSIFGNTMVMPHTRTLLRGSELNVEVYTVQMASVQH